MLRISLQDGDEELLNVLNGMLKQYPDEENGVLGYIGSNERTMGFIRMFFSSTKAILELESMPLMNTGALSEEKRKELIRRNEKLLALATMGGGMYDILHESKLLTNNIRELSNIKLTALSYNGREGDYSFELAYKGQRRYFGAQGEYAWEEVKESFSSPTWILREPMDLEGQLFLESHRELEKASGELMGKLMGNIVAKGSAAAIGALNPSMGFALEFLYHLGQGAIGDGVEAGNDLLGEIDFKSKGWEILEKGGVPDISVEVIQSYLEYLDEKARFSNEKQRLEWERTMAWFGRGGMYTVNGEGKVVIAGIYNPEMLERIGIWETYGLEGLYMRVYGESIYMEGDEKVTDDKIEAFLNSLEGNEKIIWTGGGAYKMPVKELEKALQDLQKKYIKYISKKSLSLPNLLTDKRKEEK